MYALTWEENNKEGIKTIFKTPVSSVSGDKYYQLDAVRVCNDLNWLVYNVGSYGMTEHSLSDHACVAWFEYCIGYLAWLLYRLNHVHIFNWREPYQLFPLLSSGKGHNPWLAKSCMFGRGQ